MMKSYIKYLVLPLSWVIFSGCGHSPSRDPAGDQKNIIDVDFQAMSELIGSDSPLNSYRHPLRLAFHVNGDKKYITETTRKALNQALTETLGADTPEQGLLKLALGNVKDALLENFVKTLRFHKLINMGLQFDLNFLPEPYDKNSFRPEMDSNQLVLLNQVGELSNKWNQAKSKTDTETVYNNSSLIPMTKGASDYVGGTLSVYLEILDTNARFKIPNPLKNGVKGFVRYRRFYRNNEGVGKNVSCGPFLISSTTPQSAVPVFYTVDIYKNFNLKNLIPTAEVLEIFPGLVATNKEGRSELMPDTFERSGRSIPTAVFVVETGGSANANTSFRIKKLVFDLKEKGLNTYLSEVELINQSNANVSNISDQQSLLNSSKNQFFNKCENVIEKYFSLDQIVKGKYL